MELRLDASIHADLIDRKLRLEAALAVPAPPPELRRLLGQVDAALARWEAGTFGLCEVCHDPVEADRLRVDPLIRLCLDHLDEAERAALERDLAMAAQVQAALLPKAAPQAAGWDVAWRFEPAGIVGGDYCDVLAPRDAKDGLIFAVGDVSGKGVAASILAAHLNALFRTLRDVGLSLTEMMERANRLFCESTLEAHYATLVLGRAGEGGEVELCAAAQGPPMRVARDGVTKVPVEGLPLGMFCASPYPSSRVTLDPGDLLVVYTDGLTETRGLDGSELGIDGLAAALAGSPGVSAEAAAGACLAAVDRLRAGAPRADDTTVLVLRRTA